MRVRGLLHPGGLVLELAVRPVGLDIDRAGDAGALEVGEIFLDRIVAADRLVGAEDARLHRPGQPGQIGLTPDVMMSVDDAGHAALLVASDSRCATTAALDPPSTRSSTKRWIASSASVCGLKPGAVGERRQPAHAPGPARQFCDRIAQAPSDRRARDRRRRSRRRRRGHIHRTAAPRGRPAAHRRSGCRRPNRLTRKDAAFSACSRRFSRSAGVTRVSRVPKVNTSTVPADCTSACASRMFSSVRAFIEPETSIRNRILRGRWRRRIRPSRSTSPSLRTLSRRVRRRSANGPLRARRRRWPRRRGSRRAASRDNCRSGSLVGLARSGARPAPRPAPPQARTRWPRRRAAVRPRRGLPPAGGPSPRPRRSACSIASRAAEMDVEQPVVGRAALWRRRQGRKPGAADVLQAARAEQLDRRQEARRLLRRDREAVGAQQRDKGDEDARGTRQLKVVAHAAASAMIASSRRRDEGAGPPRPSARRRSSA